jgi:hypothetical protein
MLSSIRETWKRLFLGSPATASDLRWDEILMPREPAPVEHNMDEEEAGFPDEDDIETFDDNLAVIYSSREPPVTAGSLHLASGVIWVKSKSDDGEPTKIWRLIHGPRGSFRWQELGVPLGERVMLHLGDMMIGLSAVSKKNMTGFLDAVSRKRGTMPIRALAKSELPKVWQKWLNELEPRSLELVCSLLNIVDDEPKEIVPARRRVDLED